MLVYYKDLTNVVKRYLNESELQQLDKAYLFAKKAHEDQKRSSGEPFIHHPLAVTLNLAILKASLPTLVAGLLHDVVEDSDVTLEDIKTKFGEDIAFLVDGVTKINSFTNTSKTNAAFSSIKKVLLSGVSDVRVLIIKLCDRMHNISTLQALSKEKRKRIAKETLEIYRPLALKLSLFDINKVFEDEAFKWAYPEENNMINNKIASTKKQANKLHGKILSSISEELAVNDIHNAKVLSREKTNFAIYNKIYKKGKRWEKLYDILAVRVVVKDMSQCFAVLGVLHKAFKHIPGTFKDYITIPKTNGYQSLHTCISYDGFVFEAQIRTDAMDRKANIGIASTWTYKDNEKEEMSKTVQEEHSWLIDAKNISESQIEDGDFVENFYSKLTSSNIYTLTPDNEIIIMPRGSTVLDFAYRIHTWLGDHFTHAEVNNQKVKFDHVLSNGSVIKIFTSDSPQVIERWLISVKTKTAQDKIKSSLKRLSGEIKIDFEKIGKKIVSKFLTEKQFKKINIKNVNSIFGYKMITHNDLLEAVGRKMISINDLAKIYLNHPVLKDKNNLSSLLIIDDKIFDGKLKRGGCCGPIPGEPIKTTNKNNTLIIHRQSCEEAKNLSNINASWKPDQFIDKLFEVKLHINFDKSKLGINRIINRIIRNRVDIIQIKKYAKNNFMDIVIAVPHIRVLGVIKSSIDSLPYVQNVIRQKK